MQLKLNNLRFLGHHGWHAEETAMGAEFDVSISVWFRAPAKIHSLEETLDYVQVYEAVNQRMKLPHKLLETLAMNVAEDISQLDSRITQVEVNINKINPPIKNFTGNVGVAFTKVIT